MKLKALTLALGGLFASAVMADPTSAQQAQLDQLQAQINALQQQVNSSSSVSISSSLAKINQNNKYVSVDEDGAPLGTLSTVDMPYIVLQQKPHHTSPLIISGYLEADFQKWGGNNITPMTFSPSYPDNGSDFALTTAEIYFLANLNDWTQALADVQAGLNGNSTTFDEAFVNFGNLDQFPLYATIGKARLSFGAFNGNGPWSNSLITDAFRSSQINQAIVGFSKNGINTNITVFNSDTSLNDFVYNAEYNGSVGKTSYGVGASYMNDIRSTDTAVGNAYAVNGATSQTSPLTGSRNGAFDLNANVSYNLGNQQSIGLVGEGITTTSSALYNNVDTGKMSAWNVMGTFGTPIANISSQFALGYSQTYNMENVPFPLSGNASNNGGFVPGIKSEWLASVANEVLTNVYVSPEFARQKLYTGAYTWAGTIDLSVYF